MTEQFDRPRLILLTVCAAHRRPILANAAVHTLLRAVWTPTPAWMVGRYTILPDHIHLFCAPSGSNAPSLKRWVQYWRSIVSLHWPRPAEQPIWQRDFWDTQVRRSEGYESKWEYVRHNPVRHGLVRDPDDWPYAGEIHVLRW